MNLLVTRDPFQLRSLPLRFRWEFTRRHPYYQLAWQRAQPFYRGVAAPDELNQFFQLFAVMHLTAIGVSAEPPDPATAFENLDQINLNPAWLSGAVHPVSLRGLAGVLIAFLGKESLRSLSEVFQLAAREDTDERPPSKAEAHQSLLTLRHSDLDAFPEEPYVSINPAASERQIVDSIKQLLRQWKSERQLGERRERADSYDKYLEVFDLREAWRDGRYERSEEMTLREVAHEVGRSLSTVGKQYRRAFELLMGQSYSPAVWYRTFGLIKLSDLNSNVPGRVSQHRPFSSPVRRDVPESRLASSHDPERPGLLESAIAMGGGAGVEGIVENILRLIASGNTDEQILQELNLEENATRAIVFLRGRGRDM
ncbi:MAG: hypothetical protein K8T91_00875 [Planctomycetes bacterium]|nr:hypothetical protein [Planctomycetota bacterium]